MVKKPSKLKVFLLILISIFAVSLVYPPIYQKVTITLKKAKFATYATARDFLNSQGSKDKIAVPIYELALKVGGDDLRLMAATGLRTLGKDAKPAIPELIESLGNRNIVMIGNANLGTVGEEAAMTLGFIGQDVVPALIKALQSKDINVRQDALIAFFYLGINGKTAVPEIARALKDHDWNVRRLAAFAITTIGPYAKMAVPNLIITLKDVNKPVRHQAAMALGQIGPDAKDAIPALYEALQSNDAHFSNLAAVSLFRIGGLDTGVTIPDLINALKDNDYFVRHQAVHALGELGPDVKEIIPVLKQALNLKSNDPYEPEMSSCIKETIKKIEAEK